MVDVIPFEGECCFHPILYYVTVLRDSVVVNLYPGAQLSVVTEKLNVVTDGGRRKLSVVTDGISEKGRRYHTFSHTERASVAIICLSDRVHQICDAYARHMLEPMY